jgi:hypothetical protein
MFYKIENVSLFNSHSLIPFWCFTHTFKRTKWVELIFEVEKFLIFLLQKLIQPEKNLSMHAFYAQHKTVCVKYQCKIR